LLDISDIWKVGLYSRLGCHYNDTFIIIIIIIIIISRLVVAVRMGLLITKLVC